MPAKLLLLQFTVKQFDPMLMPQDPGSMLRGAFGHALKSLSEQASQLPNQDPLQTGCLAYQTIFEHASVSPTPSNNHHDSEPSEQNEHKGSRQINSQAFPAAKQAGSHPYVLHLPVFKNPNRFIKSNNHWAFSQLLIGEAAIAHAPIAIQAWAQALLTGIGSRHKRHRAMLQTVTANGNTLYQESELKEPSLRESIGIESVTHTGIYQSLSAQINQASSGSNNSSLTLNFTSPFRAQQQGKVAHSAAQLDIKQLLYSIYNRVTQCQQIHDPDSDWETGFADFYAYKTAVDSLVFETQLIPYRVNRYSNRQNSAMSLFALTGSITLLAPAAHLKRLLPVLYLGEQLHIGKNTTLGLGQYQLSTHDTSLSHTSILG